MRKKGITMDFLITILVLAGIVMMILLFFKQMGGLPS